MNAVLLISIGALPSFAAGWFLRDLYNIIRRGEKI